MKATRFIVVFFIICSNSLSAMEKKELPTTLHQFEQLPLDMQAFVVAKLFDAQSRDEYLIATKKEFTPQSAMKCIKPFLQSAKRYYNSEEFIEKIILHIGAEFPKNAKENALIALLSVQNPGAKQILKNFVSNEKVIAQEYFLRNIERAPIKNLQKLCAAGIDVNYRLQHWYYSTALLRLGASEQCLSEEHFSRMSFLLSWGADPNSLTHEGKNALMTLIVFGMVDKSSPLERIARLLIRHKINLLQKTETDIDVIGLCQWRNSEYHLQLAGFLTKEVESQEKQLLNMSGSLKSP